MKDFQKYTKNNKKERGVRKKQKALKRSLDNYLCVTETVDSVNDC